MRSRKTVVISICAILALVLSFLYGVMTVEYKIFPFEQLRAIKQRVSPSPSYIDHFHHKKSFFEQHGRHDTDVVFIGDSITEGVAWEELFPSLKIANRGITGDTTDGVLKRLDSIYATNARKAFIMIGINDFAAGAEVNDVVDNYRGIVSNLVAYGMRPYIQSTILAGNQYAELNIKIMALNDQLKKMAAQNKTVTYIDLNAGLAKGSALDSKYSRDGIHLNGSGYAVWKDTIKSYLR
jgi:hypothetical protein